MRVVALTSFAARVDGDSRTIRRGVELDLPDGVDWLETGLVAPVAEPVADGPAPHLAGVERAVDPAPVAAEKRKRGKA